MRHKLWKVNKSRFLLIVCDSMPFFPRIAYVTVALTILKTSFLKTAPTATQSATLLLGILATTQWTAFNSVSLWDRWVFNLWWPYVV